MDLKNYFLAAAAGVSIFALGAFTERLALGAKQDNDSLRIITGLRMQVGDLENELNLISAKTECQRNADKPCLVPYDPGKNRVVDAVLLRQRVEEYNKLAEGNSLELSLIDGTTRIICKTPDLNTMRTAQKMYYAKN